MKRDIENKMIAGVCAGMAKNMEVDVKIIRIIFAVLALMSAGFPVLLYILMWILAPAE